MGHAGLTVTVTACICIKQLSYTCLIISWSILLVLSRIKYHFLYRAFKPPLGHMIAGESFIPINTLIKCKSVVIPHRELRAIWFETHPFCLSTAKKT